MRDDFVFAEEKTNIFPIISVNEETAILEKDKSQNLNIDNNPMEVSVNEVPDESNKKSAWRLIIEKARNSVILINENVPLENANDNRVLDADAEPTVELILFNEVLERTINADQTAPKLKLPNFAKANTIDIWLMGLAVVIGGQMYGWNNALVTGFGTWIIAQVLMGFAFVVLMLSLAEIGSAIAFPGGSYGLARVVLGFFPGYLVGCLELMEYSLMISASLAYIGSVLVSPQFFNCDPNYRLLIWLIFIILFLGINIPGGRILLTANLILGGSSLLLVIIYCFGSLPFTSFEQNASFQKLTDDALNSSQTQPIDMNLWFIGGISGYISILPLATWGYMGIESIVLTTSITKDPRKTVPHGATLAIITLFLTNIFIIFVTCSLPPGLSATVNAEFVMSTGFKLIFKCSETAAVSLILPAQFAMAWGFVLPIGKLLQSMSQSNLIPTCLGLSDNTTHRKSMVIGCISAYLFCLVVYFLPNATSALQNMAILCGFLTYFAQFAAFWMLRTKFSSIQRDYYSPFGLPGAVFAGLIFLCGAISVAFFQNDNYISLISLIITLVILSSYYRLFARNSQKLSKEEQKSVFRLHVINFNLRNQNFIRSGRGRRASKDFNSFFSPFKSRSSKVSVMNPEIGGGDGAKFFMSSYFMLQDSMKLTNPIFKNQKSRVMNNDEVTSSKNNYQNINI